MNFMRGNKVRLKRNDVIMTVISFDNDKVAFIDDVGHRYPVCRWLHNGKWKRESFDPRLLEIVEIQTTEKTPVIIGGVVELPSSVRDIPK